MAGSPTVKSCHRKCSSLSSTVGILGWCLGITIVNVISTNRHWLAVSTEKLGERPRGQKLSSSPHAQRLLWVVGKEGVACFPACQPAANLTGAALGFALRLLPLFQNNLWFFSQEP